MNTNVILFRPRLVAKAVSSRSGAAVSRAPLVCVWRRGAGGRLECRWLRESTSEDSPSRTAPRKAA